MDEIEIKRVVQEKYTAVAQSSSTGCCGESSSCCSGGTSSPITLVDYGVLDADLPAGANLGLGCGVPTLHANLQPGETVLDLGSGAGVDVFLAARQVGPQGRAIGVDMTPEMIARARRNAQEGGYTNVEFRLGEIEHLPVDSESVDVILSNCVLNLVPDKRRAFAELYRVLKAGGRFSISDIVTYGPIPESIRSDLTQWAGCVAGALDREEYLAIIRDTGFEDVRVIHTTAYDTTQDQDYGISSITVEGHKAAC